MAPPIAHLRDICFDCTDPRRVAQFWAAVLSYTLRPPDPGDTGDDAAAILPPDGGMRIWFNKVPEPKVVKNRVHIDVNLQDGTGMERLIQLGARPLREIRAESDGALWWTIMADPEGNEFCAFPPKQ